MATTMNMTLSGRLENLTALSGSIARSVNAVDVLDQIVSAGTEEEAAMGGFKDHQLQALVLRCTQDARAQFLGVRYAITVSVAGPPGVITTAADLTEVVFRGDLVRIEGSAGDDGVYLVERVTALPNEITLASGQPLPAAGSDGTVARVCSQQLMTMGYSLAAADGGSAAVTGILVLAGDLSDKFAPGDFIRLDYSSANDGYWEIDTVATDGPPVTETTITINGGFLPDATDDGLIRLVRASIELPANVPFLWDVESGMTNPFQLIAHDPALGGAQPDYAYYALRGDVDHCMVTVPGAVNGQFDGLVSKNPELP